RRMRMAGTPEGAALPERPAAPAGPAVEAVPTGNLLGFLLFLLLNVDLFVRPEEWLPDLDGLHLYEILILSSLAVCLPGVLRQLAPQSLRDRPVTVCVLGLLAAIMLSSLSRFQFHDAYDAATVFVKVVIYFLLLLANVTTAARMRALLVCVVGSILLVASLALLQYHGLAHIPALEALQQHVQGGDEDDDAAYTPRLQATGIYNDPNDFSMILLVCMGICVYGAGGRGRVVRRFLWLLPFALFGYALMRTQSRGGFIALLAGTLILLRARFSWKKTFLIGALVIPVIFALFAGRQTSIDLGDDQDTAQARVQLWNEGFVLFKTAPVFGIGKDNYNEEVRQPAHNSYVHCYTELGAFGGTLFVGTVYCALVPLLLLGRKGAPPITDPEMARLRPYLLAILVAYAAGMLSLSRPYVPPTYTMMGVGAAYLAIVADGRVLPGTRLNGKLVKQVLLASVLCFTGLYVFTRVFVHFGG
ncbi:MAG TPA: O-antigen ligase family protein, partial [Gemmataceae bacterium]|nr:O-antigen ligase family protein [Gemmataceae bacterium]